MTKATLSPSLAREALRAHPADHRAKTAGSHEATRRTAGEAAECPGGDSVWVKAGVVLHSTARAWQSGSARSFASRLSFSRQHTQ